MKSKLKKKIKTLVTLGPSLHTESGLRILKDKGVDFVRINMSHSSINDLKYFIALSKKVGIPFIIDTEGSQIRTGELKQNKIFIKENTEVKIYTHPITGNKGEINLRPMEVVSQLERGDILHIDFDSLILRVSDISTIQEGFITAKAISGGTLGNNKAVVIDSGMQKKINLPVLSAKDYESIKIGLDENIEYIAASFMRSKAFVDKVKVATKNKMKIISKIECIDALENLDEIIDASDFLLLDRGDLSKEIPIEKIPLTQKIILSRANKKRKHVFIATNLLETMIQSKKPTRAEVNDVINTILDGAYGLTMSAETAIGKYPIACINMLNKLIQQAEIVKSSSEFDSKNDNIISNLESVNYLLSTDSNTGLIAPHGGKLVDCIMRISPDNNYIQSLPKITLDQDKQMDVEQIAIGTFSPIEGFMGRKDFQGVLDNMRLESGEVWTIPIVLDVSSDIADGLDIGSDVALWDEEGPMAILHLDEKYHFNKDETNQKLYGTNNEEHQGVRWINNMHPVLLGGKISLFKRRRSEYKEYELTPSQTRRMFQERGWSKIVGFHTRNVIHRSHEFMQIDAMDRMYCDGLFIHPVIGKKKPGDFHAKYIINAYERMVQDFYPVDKVVFATYATFSRYAGPREAIFTALCRKNFGCSHFIVGRDHTGVGDFYHPKASHEIFDKFDDLGIEPVLFDQIFYSKKQGKYIHESDDNDHKEEEKMHISGTQARKMFEHGKQPPEWFMRPEISSMILDASNRGEEVFVPNSKKGFVIWFTGLSGSGKSSIANHLKTKLIEMGKSCFVLDGDTVRDGSRNKLGFSKEDIIKNNKRILKKSKEKIQEYNFVLVPVIAPIRKIREYAKKTLGDKYIEIFVDASEKTRIKRDPKKIYKKALSGELPNLIGFKGGVLYEKPYKPDLHIITDIEDVTSSSLRVIRFLEKVNAL